MNTPRGASFFIIGGYLLFITGILIFFELKEYAYTPATVPQEREPFRVYSGDSFHEAASRLFRDGYITNPFKFRLLARITGTDKRIQAGEYDIPSSASPSRILYILVSGKVVLHRVTVPEGFTLLQIAELIDQEGLVDKADFIRAATDPETARKFGIEAPTLEGYLFPETYHFPRPTSAESILSAMVDNFRRAFKPQWGEDAKTAGFSLHQIVTLASMVEKETGAAFERPIISSVFHNRLQKRMRLESDPTTIYGLENFDGNLTREHLMQSTSYNTYRILGLPPGPIANPGAGALEAAVYPSKTSYLYFVSKNDGTHQFSERLREHDTAVRKYQKKRGEKP